MGRQSKTCHFFICNELKNHENDTFLIKGSFRLAKKRQDRLADLASIWLQFGFLKRELHVYNQ